MASRHPASGKAAITFAGGAGVLAVLMSAVQSRTPDAHVAPTPALWTTTALFDDCVAGIAPH